MATTECLLRLLTDREKDLTLRTLDINPFQLIQDGLEILELTVKIATPSDTSTEIAACQNVLDGVDTPVKVGVRSTHADDTDSATKACREAEIIGWGATTVDGTIGLVRETIAMAGTTVVSSVYFYSRLLHIRATKFGSGGTDCAGILQIVDLETTTAEAEITTITALDSLLLADADYFTFYDINEDTCVSTIYNVWINKSGAGVAPTLDGTEIEVDISGTEDAQVSTVVATAPGAAEVSTIIAKAPGVAEVDTIVATAPGAAEVSTITCTAPGAAEVSTIIAKTTGTAEISTVIAKAFGTAEVSTIVADTFANCIDGSYITIGGINATYGNTDFYIWLDKVGDESGDPSVADHTEIRCDISGDTTAQDVSDTITAAITAKDEFGAANGGGTSTTITITNALKGDSTNIADGAEPTGLSVATVTPGVTNIPNGAYFELYGIDADYTEIGYYVWFDKVGDDVADPAPGGGLTGVDCDISGATTDLDVADVIVAAIDALDAFGADNGSGTLATVTITNALVGDVTNITDVDTGLTVATPTPGVTNMPDGSYITLYGIDSATKASVEYYVWFDKVGDTSGDPAPGSATEIYCDISADASAQDVSDCITAAITAEADFTATNEGGTSTTVTITNTTIGACTNIADVDSTLTCATTTPGTNLIADGSYIVLYGVDSTTKAAVQYYLWFDWIGDDSGDPAPGGTEIRIDMSSMTTAKNVADAITVAIDALAPFGCTDDDTTCIITNATIGAVTNIADTGATGMAVAVTTPGTNLIVDGTYFTFEAINATTKAAVKYYVWFDWIGDESGDPEPSTYTEVRCDISADVSAQDVSDCIAAAINAVTEVSAANSASTTTTVTHGTQGAVTDIADVDSGLSIAVTTPGVTNIPDGSYIILNGIVDSTKASAAYYLWFDWIGDESGDPAPGGTGIKVDMSSLTTIKNVADAITVAVDAIAVFGCTDDDTTCTITNAYIGAVDNIADTGSTGLTVATTVPGTNLIVDGTYFKIYGINGSGVEIDHYVWFDWVGDESGDPEPASHTEIRCDISGDVSAQDVSDTITAAIHAATLFTAANGTGTSTTCTFTGANDGHATNPVNVDAGLTLDTTTEGGSTATEVATAIVTAINDSAALVTAAETTYPAFTITNTDKGAVEDAADGLTTAATGFGIAITNDGVGASTLYLAIAAGGVHSNNSRIYIPDGFLAKIEGLLFYATSALSTNGTKVKISKIAFNDKTNTDDNIEIDTYLINSNQAIIDMHGIHFPVIIGTDEAYYKFEEFKVTTAVASRLKVIIFVFAE